ncbi:LysR family transcriptional regulator [Enterobacteriaceae bacterium 4M9]|nr:LysR family transcriptional regulator [Enterobacteriaceae bacterium 4M9]
MDLKRLRYFCKVMEQGSISQAARVLNMAQPPLSKRIQELEEELNVTLFLRNGKRIEPSDAGYYLYRKACEILREVEDATRETVQIARRESRLLRIGLTPLFQCYFKPLFLELHRRNPHVELNISVSDSSNLKSLLNDALIDIALIQQPQQHDGYDMLACAPVTVVAVIAKTLLPEKPVGPLPYLELGHYPLVLLHRACDEGSCESLLDQFRKGGVSPQVIMHITQPGVILDWLESGLAGATLLPSSEVDATKLHNCHVLEVFPSPQVFFPAIVKTPGMSCIQELMDILEEGFPFAS